MSWHHGNGLWRGDPFRDIEGDDESRREHNRRSEMEYILKHWDFWSYVDSESTFRGHPGECAPHPTIPGARLWSTGTTDYFCADYRHLRDAEYCMAAKSDHSQCGRIGEIGLPFCDFHLDKAWKYIAAAIDVARAEHVNERVRAAVRREMDDLGLTRAAIADAQSVLLKSNERVYFFLADHAVKIGRSINPEKRVRTLGATKVPGDVDAARGELVGTIPGGARIESSLHLRFRAHRLVGEWFEYAPIAGEIADLLAEHAEAGAA